MSTPERKKAIHTHCSIKGNALFFSERSGNTTLKMLCCDNVVWMVHLVASHNDNHDAQCVSSNALFSENASVEIDETTPVHAFVLVIAWEELSCWHCHNSQLLLKVDNQAKHTTCVEEDKLWLIERVKTFHASNKGLAKDLVDAVHESAR